MKYYYAPMEGITLYPLRNIHREIFEGSIDRYYTPFVTAPSSLHFKNREKKDILPDKNGSFTDYGHEIVPQIMAGNAETFLWAAKEIKKLGYEEVNLNLGCPAPTVVNRHKGAGLLQDTEYLDEMLSKIFSEISCTDNTDVYPLVSLKTRLGFHSEDEARVLMRIYAGYPVRELIVHARIREDYYAGEPRVNAFKAAVNTYLDSGGTANICYNGNINSSNDYNRIMDTLEGIGASISSVMIGRGLLSDPALVRVINGGAPLNAGELREYLKLLYNAYAEYIPEDRNVIFKMLEHWAFLHVHFGNCDKCLKAIRKSRTKGEYTAAVNNIFASCEFIP